MRTRLFLVAPVDTLPNAYDGCFGSAETLVITLTDQAGGMNLLLYYTVFPAVDVITRCVGARQHRIECN
ncbi:MAG: glycoside hydrolase family 36 N-terminal domain-containing protein [Eubacteriales bacterium]